LDHESQAPLSVRFSSGSTCPISFEHGNGFDIAGDADIEPSSQDGLLGTKRLIDGGCGHARFSSDRFHGGGDVAPVEEEAGGRSDDPVACPKCSLLSLTPGLGLPRDRLTHYDRV
jgi:hypothetical protein